MLFCDSVACHCRRHHAVGTLAQHVRWQLEPLYNYLRLHKDHEHCHANICKNPYPCKASKIREVQLCQGLLPGLTPRVRLFPPSPRLQKKEAVSINSEVERGIEGQMGDINSAFTKGWKLTWAIQSNQEAKQCQQYMSSL